MFKLLVVFVLLNNAVTSAIDPTTVVLSVTEVQRQNTTSRSDTTAILISTTVHPTPGPALWLDEDATAAYASAETDITHTPQTALPNTATQTSAADPTTDRPTSTISTTTTTTTTIRPPATLTLTPETEITAGLSTTSTTTTTTTTIRQLTFAGTETTPSQSTVDPTGPQPTGTPPITINPPTANTDGPTSIADFEPTTDYIFRPALTGAVRIMAIQQQPFPVDTTRLASLTAFQSQTTAATKPISADMSGTSAKSSVAPILKARLPLLAVAATRPTTMTSILFAATDAVAKQQADSISEAPLASSASDRSASTSRTTADAAINTAATAIALPIPAITTKQSSVLTTGIRARQSSLLLGRLFQRRVQQLLEELQQVLLYYRNNAI